MITQERLKELFHYNPETGVFTRLISNRHLPVGSMVGWIEATGYRCTKVQGIHLKLHRAAFLYMTGRIPVEVDHINGVRDDNRWSNLREVSRSQNQSNRKQQTNNSTGKTGVHPHKQSGRYEATWQEKGRRRTKMFGTFKEARNHRRLMESKYYREFSHLNSRGYEN